MKFQRHLLICPSTCCLVSLNTSTRNLRFKFLVLQILSYAQQKTLQKRLPVKNTVNFHLWFCTLPTEVSGRKTIIHSPYTSRSTEEGRGKRKVCIPFPPCWILLTIILSGTSCLVVVKCLWEKHKFKWHKCVWGSCLHWYHPYQHPSPICWKLWARNFLPQAWFFYLSLCENWE